MGSYNTGQFHVTDRKGRLSDSVQGSETSFVISPYRSVVGPPGPSRGSSSSFGERGGGKGAQPRFTGFLQPSFPGPQEERFLETNNRPVDPEFFCRHPFFQDGDCHFHQEFNSARSLGSFTGSHGCLFSRADPSPIPEVSSLLCKRPSVPISVAPLWSGNGPSGFHPTHGSRGGSPSPKRFCNPAVFRRLADTPCSAGVTSAGSESELGRDLFVRSLAQPNKVRFGPVTTIYVCRDELLDESEPGSSSSSTFRVSKEPSVSVPYQGQSDGQVFPFTSGSVECGVEFSRVGSTIPTTDSTLSSGSMETQSGFPVGFGPHSSPSSSPSSMVVSRGSTQCRCTNCSSRSDDLSDHGREQFGMGGSSGASRSHGLGHLVDPRPVATHKQPRVEGSNLSCLSVQSEHQGPLRASVNRQHDSSLLCTKTGGDTLSLSVSRDTRTLSALPVIKCQASSQTSPRPSECSGRQSLQTSSDSPIGMDPSTGSGQSDFQGVRDANGGSVCNQIQPSTPSLCITSPGSSGMGNRCPISGLESAGSICLPSIYPATSGITENQAVSVPNSANSTIVAAEVLVQRPARTSQGASKASSSKTRSSVSKRSRTSSMSRRASLTRMAIIREALRKKCFSERASSLISQSRRDSTVKVYDAKWNIFSDWCRRRDIDPLHPSSRRLADFFVYLFDVKKLSVSTIKGYRSMISHTLSFRGRSDIGSDTSISELMRALELKRPVSRSLAPKWDLACVLWSLTKAPYEPLAQADLQHLTWKTVFLLTLASAKRRSEIHALSMEDTHLRFNSSDDSVSMTCQTGFLAKNQLPSVAPLPIIIPSLSRTCGRDDKDRLLCPVRALKFYLDRVKTLRGSRKRLFIPLKGQHDISAASISRWIASTIRASYSQLSNVDLSFLRIRPHELRALSTSWAFINYTPLDDILRAAYWRNSSTFSSFYLRSFSSQQDNLFSLGPVVASQSVISSASTHSQASHSSGEEN